MMNRLKQLEFDFLVKLKLLGPLSKMINTQIKIKMYVIGPTFAKDLIT